MLTNALPYVDRATKRFIALASDVSLKKENVCGFEVEDQSNKEFYGCNWKGDLAKLVVFK